MEGQGEGGRQKEGGREGEGGPDKEPIASARGVVVDLSELLQESQDVLQRARAVSISVRIEAEDDHPMGPQGDLLRRDDSGEGQREETRRGVEPQREESSRRGH
jgi:hypothetical protein